MSRPPGRERRQRSSGQQHWLEIWDSACSDLKLRLEWLAGYPGASWPFKSFGTWHHLASPSTWWTWRGQSWCLAQGAAGHARKQFGPGHLLDILHILLHNDNLPSGINDIWIIWMTLNDNSMIQYMLRLAIVSEAARLPRKKVWPLCAALDPGLTPRMS